MLLWQMASLMRCKFRKQIRFGCTWRMSSMHGCGHRLDEHISDITWPWRKGTGFFPGWCWSASMVKSQSCCPFGRGRCSVLQSCRLAVSWSKMSGSWFNHGSTHPKRPAKKTYHPFPISHAPFWTPAAGSVVPSAKQWHLARNGDGFPRKTTGWDPQDCKVEIKRLHILQEFLITQNLALLMECHLCFSRNHFIALMLHMRRSGFATSAASLIEKYLETKTCISQHFPTLTAIWKKTTKNMYIEIDRYCIYIYNFISINIPKPLESQSWITAPSGAVGVVTLGCGKFSSILNVASRRASKPRLFGTTGTVDWGKFRKKWEHLPGGAP